MSQELQGGTEPSQVQLAERGLMGLVGDPKQAGWKEGGFPTHARTRPKHPMAATPYCECPAGASAVDRCPPECWPGDGSCAQRDAARGTGHSRRRSRRRRCPPHRSVREQEARARCSSFHDPLMAQGSIAILPFLWASISPGVTPWEEGRAGRSPQGTGTLRS